MTWALLAMVGTLIGTTAYTTYKLARGKDAHLADLKAGNKASLAARDHIERLGEQADDLVKERDGLTVELAAVTDKLKKEEKLRKSVEALLNEEFQKGVEHAVERVQGANIADANKIIGEILASMPARRSTGRMSETVPEGRATAPGPDSLIDPFAVRTP